MLLQPYMRDTLGIKPTPNLIRLVPGTQKYAKYHLYHTYGKLTLNCSRKVHRVQSMNHRSLVFDNPAIAQHTWTWMNYSQCDIGIIIMVGWGLISIISGQVWYRPRPTGDHQWEWCNSRQWAHQLDLLLSWSNGAGDEHYQATHLLCN